MLVIPPLKRDAAFSRCVQWPFCGTLPVVAPTSSPLPLRTGTAVPHWGRRSVQRVKDGAHIYFYSINLAEALFDVCRAPSYARNNLGASVAFCRDFVLFRKVKPHFGPPTHAIHARLVFSAFFFRSADWVSKLERNLNFWTIPGWSES